MQVGQRLPSETGHGCEQYEHIDLPGFTGHSGRSVAKTQEASKKICQDIGGAHDVFSDWAASRQGCGVGDETDKVFSKATPEEKAYPT